jgi:hypothetical protein
MFKPLDKEYWAVNIIARITFDNASKEDIVDGLRRAWILTRHHHSLIAALLEGNSHTYQTPSDVVLAVWIEETFFVHENKTMSEFLLTVPLMRYSSLNYFPDSSEIQMRTHHWTIDGIGATCFLDRYLSYFTSGAPIPSFGSEYTRLAPSYLEAPGLPTTLSRSAENAAQDAFMSFVSKRPSIGLSTLPASTSTPGGTKVLILTSPPTTLKFLVAAARKRKLGLAAAVQSAVMLATRKHAAAALAKQDFSTVAFFSHRKYLMAPYTDTATWHMGVWMVGLPVSQPEADFATIANNMQAVYGQDMALDKCSALEWYDGFCARMVQILAMPMPEGVPSPSQPQLSSLGSLDDQLNTRYEGARTVEVKSV